MAAAGCPSTLPRRPLHHELSEAERICVCGQLRIDIGTRHERTSRLAAGVALRMATLVHKYVVPGLCQEVGGTEAMTTPTSEDKSEGQRRLTGAADVAHVAKPAALPRQPSGPAVISAPKPPPPIAKGLPGAGLLAYIIVSKYFDHLPLHRLEHILKRQGLPLSRSTMCDWMAASAEALRPLYDTMVSRSLAVRLAAHRRHAGQEPGP